MTELKIQSMVRWQLIRALKAALEGSEPLMMEDMWEACESCEEGKEAEAQEAAKRELEAIITLLQRRDDAENEPSGWTGPHRKKP